MSEICLSLAEKTIEDLNRVYHEEKSLVGMVELRIDALQKFDVKVLQAFVETIRQDQKKIVWTVRYQKEQGFFQGTEEKRLDLILLGDDLKVDWIDIEYKSELWQKIELEHAKLLLSYHNFDKTEDNLTELIKSMELTKADLVKVAFATASLADAVKVCKLYTENSKPLIAIAMGEYGECSRILPAVKGMPWTYASSGAGATAPGQVSAYALKKLYRLDQVNEDTKCFTVIGNPIAHSLSPYVHNTQYVNDQLNALYVKIRVDEISAFYEIADLFNLQGASVTVPHKENIMNHADDSHWLKQVGAANTLIRKGNQWAIENTDIDAAIESIRAVLTLESPKVLILGSGGVSKGLASGMKRAGWQVTVTNRTQSKAEALSQQIGIDWLAWEDRDAHGFDVIVNGTVLGMEPDTERTPLEFYGSHTGLVVFDTVYTPEHTRFLKEAREVGAESISGREMFYRQAALQHAHWFDVPAPFAEMQVIMESLNIG